jgi:methylated-DNA-[protein]-cysteine S-methyltransferase
MNPQSPDLSKLRHWLLEAVDLPILEVARKKKGILSQLTALSYDSDADVSMHAVKVTGLVAKIIAERDPEYVRNYLLRLFWLVNDESGGICWRAPELIGEILYNCPQFGQFFPMLVSLLDLEKEDAPRFRTGTLWAIGRVAQVAREAMLPALGQVQVFSLQDQETVTKEMATWCMKRLNAEET